MRAGLMAAVLFSGGACASVDPKPAIARAESSIQDAEKLKAEEHAALEMRVAREKFEHAKAAQERGDGAKAERKATEASVEADLAAAKARHARSENAAEELASTIGAMQEEIDHGTR